MTDRLEQRIMKLERQNRWWKAWTMALIGSLGVAGLVAAQARIPSVIETKMLKIVDS